MKTLLSLFAAVALLVLAVRPALADDDYRRDGARWDRDQFHYQGGDYRGNGYHGNGHHGRSFHARHDYRPRIEHEYHYYHEVRPVYYHRPSHYYSSYHDHEHEHHRHHDHHDGRDLIAIIGGAVLVHEILNH